MTYIAIRARIGMPFTLDALHETPSMCFRVCTPYPVGILVTGQTGWIGSLGVMTGGAALDITSGEVGMSSAPGSDANGDEPGLLVSERAELKLINVSARGVAGGTEILGAMTRGAFGRLCGSGNTVSETEIKVVDFCQGHSLCPVVCRNPGSSGRNQVFSVYSLCLQARLGMAVLTRLLGVTGCAARI